MGDASLPVQSELPRAVKSAHEQRLAAALRENLKRRKAQMRAREKPDTGKPPPHGDQTLRC